MKRKLSVFIALGLVLLLVPLLVNAEIIASGECGENVTWTVDSDLLLTISGTGAMTSYPWENYKGIKNVIINDGVTSICSHAFFNFALDEVRVGESVTEIAENAFYYAYLKKAFLPDNIVTIGKGAFSTRGNTKLYASMGSKTAFSLSKMGYNFTVIETDCEFRYLLTQDPLTLNWEEPIVGILFERCGNNIKSYVLPEYVTEIYNYAFLDCRELQHVTLNNKITKLWESTFKNCSSLESIIIPDSVTYLGHDLFEGCTNLKTITLPDSITEIHPWGLWTSYPSSLSKIIIPTCNSYAHNWAKDHGLENKIKIQNHQELIHHDKVDSTYSETGTEEYWECSACGKLFSDENGKDKIKKPIIIPRLARTKISEATISKIKNQVYTGKAIEPNITIKYNGKKLKKDTDYTLSFKKNKYIGTATVTVKGLGTFTGTKTITFIINPKPVKISSLKAGKKQLTVKWKKGTSISGYEIQYGTKENFKKAKTVSISDPKTVSTVITGLKKGNTYYVRIRAFKTVGDITYYSIWSEAASKKVEK